MSSIKVKVNQGIVRGCEEKLPDGRTFNRFSGIPYAKPPINELRFKSPQKLEKFIHDEIDCTIEGDACLNQTIYSNGVIGSEDCLYLNVYAPSKVEPNQKLPVMFYIHGGGFNFDSGSIQWYSPEYLLMENVIVVTINYRLHVLGFLSLPSMGISGNAGLKDQQMALEWVHENISSFNGDPDNICLFGESAGGSSVHLQVLNKRSRKYIRSAICQSGCALGDWVLQRDAIQITKKLAKVLGCQSNDDDEIYKTLMNTSADVLFKFKGKPQDPDERRRNLRFTFKPSIELKSDDAFMTEWPRELIKNQKGEINTPIIFGTTDKDGAIMVSSYRLMLKSFDEDPLRFLPRSINLDPNTAIAKKAATEVKDFYFEKKGVTKETIPQFVDHMTDFHFLKPQTISNELHVLYQPKAKQFLYEFSFDGELNHYKRLIQMTELNGAAHGDDVCYLFDQRVIGAKIDENSKTWKMRKTMCKLWTNFAKYQDPTPDHDNPLTIKWNPVQPWTKDMSEINLDYLVINDDIKMVRNLNHSRMDFWREFYRKWNKSFTSSILCNKL